MHSLYLNHAILESLTLVNTYNSCFNIFNRLVGEWLARIFLWAGGQTSIRPYWRCYFPNTQAVIYVVDSSDTDRIGVAKEEFHAILEVNNCLCFLFRCNWFITLLIDEGNAFTVVALLGNTIPALFRDCSSRYICCYSMFFRVSDSLVDLVVDVTKFEISLVSTWGEKPKPV